MNRKYNFVYKITNNLNGDYYYGVHSTNNLDDGYMGSGSRINRSINKYGKENFTREIVQFFSRKKCAYSLESAIVTQKLIDDPHCLNLAIGGFGGNTYAGFTDGQLKEIGAKISKANKGKNVGPFTEEHKQKLRYKKSDAHKQKLSEAKKGKKLKLSDEQHQHRSNITKGKNNPMYGKNAEDYMTPEAIKEKRIKQSKKMKDYYKNPENRKRLGLSSLNKKCINNGTINKLVQKSELELFLNNGWQLGRIKKNKLMT